MGARRKVHSYDGASGAYLSSYTSIGSCATALKRSRMSVRQALDLGSRCGGRYLRDVRVDQLAPNEISGWFHPRTLK